MERITQSLGSLTDRIVCVIFAVLFSQAPVYMAQYEDVLSGAQMEASIKYDDLKTEAKKFGQTLDEYIDELSSNENEKVRGNAALDAQDVERYESYTAALTALHDASAFTKPFVFMSHFSSKIHSVTASQFEPNIPLTPEGLFYAFLGLLFGMGLVRIVGNLFGKIFKKEKIPTEV